MKKFAWVIFLIAFALSSCAPASTTTSQPPAAVASATATAAPPTATATLTPTEDPSPKEFPLAVCCLAAPIEAGTYRLPTWLGMNFTIVVPAEWGVVHDDATAVFALARGQNELSESSQFIQFNVIPATVALADFQQDVLDSPEFVFGTPEEVTIAGFSGFRVEAQAVANPNEIGNRETHIAPGIQHISVLEDNLGGVWVTSTPEARVRFTALDVNGVTLLIFFEAEKELFDAFLVDADAMVASLALVQ